jgi:4-amino-4-deoxy-L-arabinose transferase-like glycosyltransferase
MAELLHMAIHAEEQARQITSRKLPSWISLTPASRIPLTAALVTFALHAIGNPHYGFFRDELYFIVCGRHPQWGYADQPVLAPFLAAASQLFGPSLVLLRAVPAFFAAAGVYVTCLLAIEFGGAAFAQFLAAVSVFFAPILMDFGMKVSPDMVGLWLWPLVALYVVRLARGAHPRLWVSVGVVAGLAIQGKYTVIFFLLSLLAGLLLTRTRAILRTRWTVLGSVVCALIALPSFLWQAQHGYPHLEILRLVQRGTAVNVGPLTYVLQQVVLTGVLLAAIWIAGLIWLFRQPGLRFLAFGFLVLMTLMIALHAKHYYPADIYPYLFAAGAVAIERCTTNRWLTRTALTAAAVIMGLMTTPLVMPVLPEPQMVSYTHWLLASLRLERKTLATDTVPQRDLANDWAAMHGWPELVATVARVYWSLPESDRRKAVIATQNFGEASAIDFLGQPYGLPRAISGHNQYYLWGTHGYSGNVTICVGGDCGASAHLFDRCELAATFTAPWVQPDEDGLPIVVCHGIRRPLAEIWPATKFYR